MNVLFLLLLLQNPAEGVGIDQRIGRSLALDLPFREGTGREAPLGRCFEGRPVILALVYFECPMLCTQVMRGLAATLRTLKLEAGRDYDLVAVSIDPRETPELAAAAEVSFARACGRSDDGLHFLTGPETSIRRLAADVGFRYRFDASTGLYAHAAGIVVVTPEGRLARYFPGIDYPPRDVRLAIVEASEGRVGTLADDLLLLCFQYDPVRGRYGFAIMTAVRAGGALSAGVLAAAIWIMMRRERRRRLRP